LKRKPSKRGRSALRQSRVCDYNAFWRKRNDRNGKSAFKGSELLLSRVCDYNDKSWRKDNDVRKKFGFKQRGQGRRKNGKASFKGCNEGTRRRH
jgi:hypothetical protein